MPVASLGSRSLHYVRRGDGAPLFLIQGMAGHHCMWGEPLLTDLERDFDVVAYDHRGIGDSTDVPGPCTIADLAEDAAGLLDALGWESAHVMGISMGGMVAQELALAHPERVRTLTLGCTYAGGEGSSLAAPGPMRMFEAMSTGSIDTAVRAAFEANLSPAWTAAEEHFDAFREVSLAVRVKAEVVLRQAQAAVAHDASARLASLAAPTLLMHGTADEMIPFSNLAQISALLPRARTHTFTDVGHLYWWEQPDVTTALLREHCLT